MQRIRQDADRKDMLASANHSLEEDKVVVYDVVRVCKKRFPIFLVKSFITSMKKIAKMSGN